jgi:hypothetical protein
MNFFLKRPPAPLHSFMRDIIVTTIYDRSARADGHIWEVMRNCADEIGNRLSAIAPKTYDAAAIDWLLREIEREEFSICEDVLDGSAA